MPSIGISIQCARIFWTPVRSLVEYQCEFCQESFLNHYDLMLHFKICLKKGTHVFDRFPEPVKCDQFVERSPEEIAPVIKEEPEIWIKPEEDVEDNANNRTEDDHASIAGFSECSNDSAPDESSPSNERTVPDDGEPIHTSANIQPNIVYHRERDMTIYSLQRKLFPSKGKANDFGNLMCRNKTVMCDMCGYKGKTRRGILHHMIVKHHEKIQKKELRCPICSKTYANTSSLCRHIDSHSTRYSCEYCGNTFSDKTNLKVHIRIHTGERPYTCKLCGNTFSSTNSLNSHMRMHRNDRPFKCPHCPKSFITRTQQKSHLNVHTRAFRETCGLCNKVFTSAESLKQHGRIHTGLRPYKCEVCDRRFGRQNAYSVHMNTHTGNSPYACKLCDRRFHSPAARRSHEKGVHKVP